MNRILMRTWVGAALLSVMPLGCDTTRSAQRSTVGPDAWQPTMHWVQEEELRTLMREIDAATRSAWMPQELAEEPRRADAGQSARFTRVAELALVLAESAGRIPSTVANRRMSEADRRAFTALSAALEDQARALGSAATQHQREEMEAALTQIGETCVSCHSRFRDFTPHFSPQQAEAKASGGQPELRPAVRSQ